MTHRLSNRCSEKGARWNQIHSSSSSSFTTTKRLASVCKTFFSLHLCSNFQMRAPCKTWRRQSTTDADLQRTYSQVFLVHEHRWRHNAQISLFLQCLRVVTRSFLLALCGLKTHTAMNGSVSRKKRTMLFFSSISISGYSFSTCLQKRWCMNFEDVTLNVLFAMKAHDLRDIWYAVFMCSLHKKQ